MSHFFFCHGFTATRNDEKNFPGSFRAESHLLGRWDDVIDHQPERREVLGVIGPEGAKGQGGGPDTPQLSGNVTCKITFDLTCRFLMLDMRWKALDRAMNLS